MFDKLKNGYIAEERFILECLAQNIPVSRPVFNVEPYDFIVEVNDKLLRVQVKKSWVDLKGRHIVSIKGSYPRSEIKHAATKDDRVDIIAVADGEKWYFIPREEVSGVSSQFCVSDSGKYAKYIMRLR